MPTAALTSFDDGLRAVERERTHFVHTPDLADDRLWVPYSEGIWFQPCHLNVSTGGFTILVKILPGVRVPKHYHIGPVQGLTLQGKWRYLEYDWVATAGSFNFEPAGEAHTLMVPHDAAEPMIALFMVSAGMIFIDDAGAFLGYEDGFTLLRLVRDHYRRVGIDASRVDAVIR